MLFQTQHEPLVDHMLDGLPEDAEQVDSSVAGLLLHDGLLMTLFHAVEQFLH